MVTGIVLLAIGFLVCLAATLRLAGLRVLLALALAGVLMGIVLPETALGGVSPLAVGLPAGALTAVLGCLLIGGWNRKSFAAGLGALTALLLASVFLLTLAPFVQMTGLDQHFGPNSHLEVKLWYGAAYGRVDFAGLYAAAVVLALVGAVMDMAMVIASSVREAGAAIRAPSFRALFRTGVRAGRGVLGPMLVTMLLLFFAAELAPTVARAGLPGGGWGTFRLLNYESLASHVVESLTAAFGFLLAIPAAAFLAAWLLRNSNSPENAKENAPVEPAVPAGAIAWRVSLPIAAAAAVILLALAVTRGYEASYDNAGMSFDAARNTRRQEALARVLSIQPPVALTPDPERPHNPVRGPQGDKLFPCAAEILTGENRGKLVAFVNRMEPRSYVNVRLRPGASVLLALTTSDGRVLEAEVHPLPMRWRPLLWGAAAVMVLVVAGLGRYGLRAVLLTLFAAAVLGFFAVPLFVKGVSPPGVVLVSFGLLTLGLLVFWGTGWRSALPASAGTLLGLAVSGAVAFAACRLMGISGTASATNLLLLEQPAFAALNLPQLLAAGMALMVMGAALDVAASVTTGLTEFRDANPRASARDIFQAGLRLNRDVAGMMVLTVFFAWLALRLPILVMMHRAREAFDPPWVECYAMEVIRFVSGSIALLLAGPFSVMLFSIASRKGRSPATETPRKPPAELPVMVIGAVLAATCGALWMAHTPRVQAESRIDVFGLEDVSSSGEIHTRAAERARLSDWDGCMILLWKAREIAPADPAIRRDLAYAYMARNWRELAWETLRPALPRLRNDARTRYLCGVLALWDGDKETAGVELRRALEIDPSLSEAADALQQIR